MRTEAEAERWLLDLVDYERRPPVHREASVFFHLDRFVEQLNALGRPQDDYPSVHIAGTAGKGWIASALAAICQAAGLRVGLYTSPHLASFRERIRVDGRMISPKAFVEGIVELGPRFGAADDGGFRTVFEILTALGFQHFSRRGVDLAIIETGLGGRLDCTTAVQPILSIIASLGLDHTAILGNTLAEIAWEKAGIIKPRTPVILSLQPSDVAREAMPVIRDVARKRQAPIIPAGRRVRLSLVRESLRGSEWKADLGGRRLALHCRSFGPSAQINLTTVLAAVDFLRVQGFEIPDSAVKQGLVEWIWPGRLEVIRAAKPAVIIDGAHNPLEARTLRAAIDGVALGVPVHWVVAMLRDKDIAGVLRELAGGRGDDSITTFPAPSPRALNARELACHALDLCSRVSCRPTIKEALNLALQETRCGVVVVAGSLYIVEPARQALREILP
ncbi:MAG: bifunctional folylpolyglutamate synthase/dihydrofolate synthase [Candidatus Sumerlaeota bacterium]|nr:bifunctional folylpolyglutamate synthase/dihydrofolate synthase [Candidatus Sumerlaeota bacterium]